jgi:hypothetical protein
MALIECFAANSTIDSRTFGISKYLILKFKIRVTYSFLPFKIVVCSELAFEIYRIVISNWGSVKMTAILSSGE